MKTVILISMSIFAFFGHISAQVIENLHFEQKEQKIVVSYDLAGDDNTPYFLIQLFYSGDNGQTWIGPLQHVSGDVGSNQPAGKSKLITWDVLGETAELKGNIQFKISATPVKNERMGSGSTGQMNNDAEASSFSGTYGVFSDSRDGKVYKWVRIESQVWMAQNLNVGIMINGRKIQTKNDEIEKYCYNDEPSNCDAYGGLYQWDEMMQHNSNSVSVSKDKSMTINTDDGKDPRNKRICPAGWHIPSDDEWNELSYYLGGETVSGEKLKEKGTVHWKYSSTSETLGSNFNALAAGFRAVDGKFSGLGYAAYFWSSRGGYFNMFSGSVTGATGVQLKNDSQQFFKNQFSPDQGFSVRCLKD